MDQNQIYQACNLKTSKRDNLLIESLIIWERFSGVPDSRAELQSVQSSIINVLLLSR
jgi:hypothetical protein